MTDLDYNFVTEVLVTVIVGSLAIYIGWNGLQAKRPKAPRVSHVLVYPIKSCAEMEVESAVATKLGFQGDRIFQVSETTEEASYCTPRDAKYAKLFTIRPKLTLSDDGTPTALSLTAPDGDDDAMDIDLTADDAKKKETNKVTPMIGPKVTLEKCSAAVNTWLAKALGVPDQSIALTGIGKDYKRKVHVNPDQKEALPIEKKEYDVSLADEAPYLLTSTTSLHDLNRRLKARGKDLVDMRRFRPNLVIDHLDQPWIEDTFKRIRIGKAEFHVWQRCGRCAMTTIDRDTLARGPEPLATLSTFRERDAGQRNFGMHLIPVDSTMPAKIHVGDPIEVLEVDAERVAEWKRLFGPKK